MSSWEGVENPSNDDWIAVYLKDSDPSLTAPVQYIQANESESHMESGKGSIRYEMPSTIFQVVQENICLA